MQKLNFPVTAWRRLALIGTQKTCFDCAFVKKTLLSVVSKTWAPLKTTTCFHLSPFVSFQRMYYHEPSGQCFELYKRGPCAEGHILSYNYGQLRPQCKCKDHYHLHVDGKCYSLNTEGKTRIANRMVINKPLI